MFIMKCVIIMLVPDVPHPELFSTFFTRRVLRPCGCALQFFQIEMEMKEKRVHDNIIRERKEEMNVEEQKGENRGISTDLIWRFPFLKWTSTPIPNLMRLNILSGEFLPCSPD